MVVPAAEGVGPALPTSGRTLLKGQCGDGLLCGHHPRCPGELLLTTEPEDGASLCSQACRRRERVRRVPLGGARRRARAAGGGGLLGEERQAAAVLILELNQEDLFLNCWFFCILSDHFSTK